MFILTQYINIFHTPSKITFIFLEGGDPIGLQHVLKHSILQSGDRFILDCLKKRHSAKAAHMVEESISSKIHRVQSCEAALLALEC